MRQTGMLMVILTLALCLVACSTTGNQLADGAEEDETPTNAEAENPSVPDTEKSTEADATEIAEESAAEFPDAD